jgi:hypothetical protein
MAYTDTESVYRVRKSERQTKFGELLNGRTFLRTSPSTPWTGEVWIKFTKDFAQPINDNNRRICIDHREMIKEVILVLCVAKPVDPK